MHVLETLGISPSDSKENIGRFNKLDQNKLQAQLAIRDDEQKLIQSAYLASKEQERLLEVDSTPNDGVNNPIS